jgi:hypothetical protein
VLDEFKIRSAFETGGLVPKLHALARLSMGLLSGEPCALQIAMFSNPDKGAELLARIESFKPDVIYLDGIRLVDYAALIRRKAPGRPLIVDFDDLMSRRADILHDAQLPLSAGYLAKSIPGPIVRLANSRLLRRIFLRYEAFCLKRHEREAVRLADAVTLVSTSDAAALTRLLDSGTARKVHVIAPPVTAAKPVYWPAQPLRFVFIGSDNQVQNRLAIDYLVELWTRLAPRIELVIFGRMVREYAPVPNITMAGFASNHEDVYTDRSIALCPAFLRGGIKSKLLEAISHGCLPVGNIAAYEGLGFYDDALAMGEAEFEQFVTDPLPMLDDAMNAAIDFARYCQLNHSVAVFAARWRKLLALSPVMTLQPSVAPAVSQPNAAPVVSREILRM